MSFATSLKLKIANTLGASIWMPLRARLILYRVCGLAIRAKSVRHGCFFYSPQVRIGPGSFINAEIHFDSGYTEHGSIVIGENCFVAMRVSFVTHTHEVGSGSQRAGRAIEKPITIGNGVWIGAGAMILPGVTIADGCIVAAGAVVAEPLLEPNCLYAGVPAKKIRMLDVYARGAADSAQSILHQGSS